MKFKTEELEGRLLDFAVRLSLGHSWEKANQVFYGAYMKYPTTVDKVPRYHINWTCTGPLIDGIRLTAVKRVWRQKLACMQWCATNGQKRAYARTPQTAICRLVVLVRNGKEVDLPDSLVQAWMEEPGGKESMSIVEEVCD